MGCVLCELGASQFNEMNKVELVWKESFFNWYYWSINCGALFAFTVIAYLCQDVSFTVGFSIPPAFLLVALIFLVSSAKYYKVARPSGSIMGRFFEIVRYAMRKRKYRESQVFIRTLHNT